MLQFHQLLPSLSSNHQIVIFNAYNFYAYKKMSKIFFLLSWCKHFDFNVFIVSIEKITTKRATPKSVSPTTAKPHYVYIYVPIYIPRLPTSTKAPPTTTTSTTTTPTTTTSTTTPPPPTTTTTTAKTSSPTTKSTTTKKVTQPTKTTVTTTNAPVQGGNEVSFCSGTGINCFRCFSCWPGGWCVKDGKQPRCLCTYGWTGQNAIYSPAATPAKKNIIRANNCNRACHYTPFVR